MLAAPPNIVRRICTFLGEEFSESVIEFRKSTDPASKTPLLSKGLQKGNVEKWRTAMSDRDRRVFEAAAGDTLSAWGYPFSTDARPLPLLLRAAYRLHNRVRTALYEARLNNKHITRD